ncbi:hypothetical protein SEA_FORZA_12 [Gordonia phage Forza]|uniref:Uncharacterized protein n=1 Tax=Gordonia phage Forza TaxID=2571247 RepID=A0A650EZA8_9CAUD|nr:hypothetical protein PP303_gp012 [Gordonia phage Forza]QEM41481.1 hypothetical protein SEA_BOOPY_12 [Gordonia phage Boopy]QGT55005.1 hypothetical protein SEA_FORZA_12 [Gordonia phage Forza]UXE04155.1 hypothetical protein SEA_BLUENGOLD_11 [Gordonia phage BlueNGold]WBF03793.1 hypothetical protein SEA_MAREELIH_10 [Gordonia phage Mareelih]
MNKLDKTSEDVRKFLNELNPDPAVEAARRAMQKQFGRSWIQPSYQLDVRTDAAREALIWAADVIAQEIREQWAKDAQRGVCAQMIAQRLQVLEKVIRPS